MIRYSVKLRTAAYYFVNPVTSQRNNVISIFQDDPNQDVINCWHRTFGRRQPQTSRRFYRLRASIRFKCSFRLSFHDWCAHHFEKIRTLAHLMKEIDHPTGRHSSNFVFYARNMKIKTKFVVSETSESENYHIKCYTCSSNVFIRKSSAPGPKCASGFWKNRRFTIQCSRCSALICSRI